MTDFEKLQLLLKQFGIGFTILPDEKRGPRILITYGDTKVDGYRGFFAAFDFDTKGVFEVVNIAE